MMNKNIDFYQKEIKRLSSDFDIPFRIIATIALNESDCNPMVKPFFERTWRYFTDRQGRALNLIGGNKDVQRQALAILGEKEYTFQVHAHGAFQVVGSRLRELGYVPDTMVTDFYTQGVFGMKHLSSTRDRFIRKFRHEPNPDQFYAMYNGGFGAVTDDGVEEYVIAYVDKSVKNERRVA